jgi:hypothetical protein
MIYNIYNRGVSDNILYRASVELPLLARLRSLLKVCRPADCTLVIIKIKSRRTKYQTFLYSLLYSYIGTGFKTPCDTS